MTCKRAAGKNFWNIGMRGKLFFTFHYYLIRIELVYNGWHYITVFFLLA